MLTNCRIMTQKWPKVQLCSIHFLRNYILQVHRNRLIISYLQQNISYNTFFLSWSSWITEISSMQAGPTSNISELYTEKYSVRISGERYAILIEYFCGRFPSLRQILCMIFLEITSSTMLPNSCLFCIGYLWHMTLVTQLLKRRYIKHKYIKITKIYVID